MGIKRFLFFVLVFQLNTSLFSQESKDTIFLNNHYYVKHIVEYNQTIDEISEKYNVAVKRILETNETSIKLFYNQTLYIPIKRDEFDNNSFQNTSLSNNKDLLIFDNNISFEQSDFRHQSFKTIYFVFNGNKTRKIKRMPT